MNSDWPIYPKFNNDWRWRWKEISVPSTADSEYLAELVKAVEGTGKFKKLIVTTFQFPRAYKMTPTDEQILTNFRKKIAQVIADLWYLEAGRSLVKAVVENYSVAIVPRLTLTFSVHSTAHGSDPRNDNAVIPDRFSEPELAAGEPTARTGVGGGRLEFEVWKAVSLANPGIEKPSESPSFTDYTDFTANSVIYVPHEASDWSHWTLEAPAMDPRALLKLHASECVKLAVALRARDVDYAVNGELVDQLNAVFNTPGGGLAPKGWKASDYVTTRQLALCQPEPFRQRYDFVTKTLATKSTSYPLAIVLGHEFAHLLSDKDSKGMEAIGGFAAYFLHQEDSFFKLDAGFKYPWILSGPNSVEAAWTSSLKSALESGFVDARAKWFISKYFRELAKPTTELVPSKTMALDLVIERFKALDAKLIDSYQAPFHAWLSAKLGIAMPSDSIIRQSLELRGLQVDIAEWLAVHGCPESIAGSKAAQFGENTLRSQAGGASAGLPARTNHLAIAPTGLYHNFLKVEVSKGVVRWVGLTGGT
jgi:hypothetical protein